MNGTRSGPRELAEAVGGAARELAGKVRRMIVTRTRTALWQVTGHLLLDGTTETRDAENFAGGVGFYSRPSEDEDTEAIVAFPGGPGNPIIVATRQEAVRRVIAADLNADETQIHNSAVVIRIKANGTVEIRTAAGVAAELATKADLAALRAVLLAWVPVAMDGGLALKTLITTWLGAGPAYAWPAGTTVLKAE